MKSTIASVCEQCWLVSLSFAGAQRSVLQLGSGDADLPECARRDGRSAMATASAAACDCYARQPLTHHIHRIGGGCGRAHDGEGGITAVIRACVWAVTVGPAHFPFLDVRDGLTPLLHQAFSHSGKR